MSNSQPGEASEPVGELGQPTLYEFLTRLVSSPDARAAFDADPRAALDQAGLDGMSSTDVLQASSLVLDYAPIEVVEEYDRSLQSSVEKFAANTQFAAFNQLHSAHPHEQEVTEQSMLHSTQPPAPDFSDGGDVDPQLPEPAPAPAPTPAPPSGDNTNIDVDENTEISDSGNLLSVHDVNIANGVGNANSVAGDSLSGVGNVVDNSVSELTGTVEHTVDTGAEFGAGAGIELNETINNGLDTGAGLVEGAAGSLPAAAPADAGVPELPTDNLPVPGVSDLPVVGEVTSTLPVDDVASTLPAPSDLPVVGGPVGEPVEGVVGQLPLDDVL